MIIMDPLFHESIISGFFAGRGGLPLFLSIFLRKELSKITINTKTVVLPLNIAIITII